MGACGRCVVAPPDAGRADTSLEDGRGLGGMHAVRRSAGARAPRRAPTRREVAVPLPDLSSRPQTWIPDADSGGLTNSIYVEFCCDWTPDHPEGQCRRPHPGHHHGFTRLRDRPPPSAAGEVNLHRGRPQPVLRRAAWWPRAAAGTIGADAGQPDFSRHSLGIIRFPLPCGTTLLGHTGTVPGYLTFAGSSQDAHSQIALSVTPLATEVGPAIGRLLQTTFCGSGLPATG